MSQFRPKVCPAGRGLQRAMCGIHGDFLRSQKSDVYCRSLHFFPGLHCSPSPVALYSSVFQVALFLYSAVGNCALLCCALRRATLHCGVFVLVCFFSVVFRCVSVGPCLSFLVRLFLAVSACMCLTLFLSLVCLSLYVSGPPTAQPCRVSATCR